MGAALGAALASAGHDVRWASPGRSAETVARATTAGFTEAPELGQLLAAADVVISVCPPHAALGVARAVAAASTPGPLQAAPTYVDANAVSPETTKLVGRIVQGAGWRFVDGGIIGSPPGTARDRPRLYLSGPDALESSELFATPMVETHVVSELIGAASALKLAYAAWTKGSQALMLAARAAAAAEGVEPALVEEWRTSQPDLVERSARAADAAFTKGWRWAGEMDEIATMFAIDGLPSGFHHAAAETYRKMPRPDGAKPRPEGDELLRLILDRLR
jgi:3-hydroxyisobutyrate dehydrogenase-like beta-hydroxyacid dehydrogenase